MITGEDGAGKSHIAALVRKQLQQIGMEVEFVVNDDFAGSENAFNSIVNVENEFAISKIANTAKVTIIEGSPRWVKKSVDDRLTYNRPKYYKKVSAWAQVYHVNDWKRCLEKGLVSSETGEAFWAQYGLQSDINAFTDTVDDATHVVYKPYLKTVSTK